MKKIIFLGMCILVFMFSVFNVEARVFNLSITDDTHLRSDLPYDGIFHTQDNVYVGGGNPTRKYTGFVKIDSTAYDYDILKFKAVTPTNVVVYPNDPSFIYYCENGFTESTMKASRIAGLNCDSEPFYNWTEEFSSSGSLSLELDITEKAKNDSDGIFTLMFKGDEVTFANANFRIYSSEASASVQPYIEYTQYDCNESWVEVESSCQPDNSRFIEYVSNAINCTTTYNLPNDNNTYESCNYCSSDLELVEDSLCIYNGSAYVSNQSYVDHNYYGCCAITGISSDCPTEYYPYNETIESFCVSGSEDFELDLDENVFFAPFVEDKVYAKIWLDDITQNYSCISYIKTLDGYNQDKKDVVQVNPDYYKNEKTYFSPVTNEYEDREYFETNKGITTIYYKKDNLILDGRPYLFGVECSGSNNKTKLTAEKVGYVNWKYFNEPLTRFEWATNETLGMVIGICIMFVIMFLIGTLWIVIKR